MSTVSIDLRSKIVRSDTKVWRVFPGQGYMFLDAFLQQSRVFLDLPGASLPAEEGTFYDSNLRNIVKRAHAIAEYVSAQNIFLETGEGTAPSRPPSSLRDYENVANYRAVGNGVSALFAMFWEAVDGDLIVMPEPPAERMIRIGQFVDNPQDRQDLSLDPFYPGYQTSSRAVRWLARVEETKLPWPVTASLRHQVPISDLGTDHILNVLDFAYGSYLYGNDVKGARIDTGAAKFNEQDNLDLSILIKICSAISWDWANEEDLNSSIADSVINILPDEANISISTNINSRGNLTIKGSTYAPILFVALFTLFLTCDAKPTPEDIAVTNSAANADDPSPQLIQEMLRQHMAFMGESDWNDLKAMSKRLKDNPKLSVASRGITRPR